MELNDIFKDYRGDIYSITGNELDYPEIVILTAKEGYARGGCIHNINDEYYCVIQGTVTYHIGDRKYLCSVGMSGCIPKNTPHYFIAHTDAIVIEWGATIEEKKEKDMKTREVVDEINRRL